MELGQQDSIAVGDAVIAVGIEGLKEAVKNMPGIPTYGYIGFVGWDEFYWTNWPYWCRRIRCNGNHRCDGCNWRNRCWCYWRNWTSRP